MAKQEANPNYTHACLSPLIAPKQCICSIADAGYTCDEFKSIIEFYVLNAPILKSDKSDLFGLKNLKDYGWRGNGDMNKLERELLKDSKIHSFCFIKASTIHDTLEQMLLGENGWCAEHPRAVLKQEFGVTVTEDGKVEISNSETRMECLFRHIRNALAHNHVYVFDNGNILLEDMEIQSKSVTARILLSKNTLLNWINIVKKVSPQTNEGKVEKTQEALIPKASDNKSV